MGNRSNRLYFQLFHFLYVNSSLLSSEQKCQLGAVLDVIKERELIRM